MKARILSFLSAIAKNNWVLVLLISGLIFITLTRLSQAAWVKDNLLLLNALLSGTFLGWCLTRSRFRGPLAAGYSLILSLLAAAQWAGHIFPAINTLWSFSPLPLLNHTNLRLVSFLYRVSSWSLDLSAGKRVLDPGFLVFLLYFLLWNAAAWLLWFTVRRHSGLTAVIPLALIVTINSNLTDQNPTPLVLFIACSLLLVARTALTRQNTSWETQAIDYPEDLGTDWGMGVVLVVIVVSLAARAAPLFGTPQGRQEISDFFRPSPQHKTPITTPPSPPRPAFQNQDEFVGQPDLNRIGAPISQSDATVMWVYISDPPPPPAYISSHRPPGNYYWRSAVYSTYTGQGWENTNLPVSTPHETETLPIRGRYLLKQHFEFARQPAKTLFSANYPISTSDNVALRQAGEDETSLLVYGYTQVYDVTSQIVNLRTAQLDTTSSAYPKEILSVYLQLPDGLPARVRELAHQVSADAATPYQKALRIQEYLRNNYPYQLDAPPPPQDTDLVDLFLFEAPGGFCSHYASAMVVMLRTLGVPARIASGYAAGQYDPHRGAYRVPASAMHAWVEVYFNEYGWVEFEPTAAYLPPDYEQAVLANHTPTTHDTSTGTFAVPWLIILAAALAALSLATIYHLIRQLRNLAPDHHTPLGNTRRHYRSVRRSLKWIGYQATPATTPAEFCAQFCAAQASTTPRLCNALRLATNLYTQALYTPHPPDPRAIRQAQNAWKQARGEWQRVFWQKRVYNLNIFGNTSETP